MKVLHVALIVVLIALFMVVVADDVLYRTGRITRETRGLVVRAVGIGGIAVSIILIAVRGA